MIERERVERPLPPEIYGETRKMPDGSIVHIVTIKRTARAVSAAEDYVIEIVGQKASGEQG